MDYKETHISCRAEKQVASHKREIMRLTNHCGSSMGTPGHVNSGRESNLFK